MKNTVKIFLLIYTLAAVMLFGGCTSDSGSVVAEIDLSDPIGVTEGASFKNDVLTVKKGGAYTLKGKLDGGITVDAAKADVELILNGVDIENDEAAIYVKKAAAVTLTLIGENSVSDGDSYNTDKINACIYSKCDLSIRGDGTLAVKGNSKNGINCKDNLEISAAITVTAVNHGICGKDSLNIKNATLTVNSGGDGLRSTNTDDGKGTVTVSDSTLNIESAEDGIQAESSLKISGGVCKIKAGGGSENAPKRTTGDNKTTADNSESQVFKGIKAGKRLDISSGEFEIDSSDDALHCNGSAELSGGKFTLKTGDDGLHCDENCKISGGDINISECYEGVEGANVEITDGTICITADDDGINAAGGNDSSGFFGDKFASGDYSIKISGGTVKINASGDGIDSNGLLGVSGGEIYVSGAENDGNSAIDYDGTAKITGGKMIAAGMRGMAQNFGSESTQGAIMVTFDSASTDEVILTDKSGKKLLSYKPEKQFDCVVVSCPEIAKGEAYTVSAGKNEKSVEMTDIIYGDSTMGGKNPTDGKGFGNRKDGKDFGGEMPQMPEGGTTPPEKPDGMPNGERPSTSKSETPNANI